MSAASVLWLTVTLTPLLAYVSSACPGEISQQSLPGRADNSPQPAPCHAVSTACVPLVMQAFATPSVTRVLLYADVQVPASAWPSHQLVVNRTLLITGRPSPFDMSSYAVGVQGRGPPPLSHWTCRTVRSGTGSDLLLACICVLEHSSDEGILK